MLRRQATRLKSSGCAAMTRVAFATSSQTTPQEVATTWGSSGILSTLGFTNASVGSVPMTDPFPGTVEPYLTPPPSAPSKIKLTTLSNDFRVASEDIWGTTAGIGLAVASGSQNETHAISGLSHYLEYMAFKGTKNRTHFRVIQELTGYGAHFQANASREQMYYSVECLKADVPAAVEVLCDTVFNPKFNAWDVEDMKPLAKFNLDEHRKNPSGLLGELLMGSVYFGGLGNPLIGTTLSIDRLDANKLIEFHAENFTPGRMVLAVAGIEHDALLKIAEPIAGILPKGEKYTAPISTYIGGEIKKPEDDELCHLILAFDVEGGWEDLKSACVTTVLMYLMGGGGSFSSGGPGKGMHSRLYLNVLTKYGWVHNFSAFNQPFDKRCLMGIYGAVPPDWASKLVDVMTEELISLSKKISDVELSRAKNAAIGQILMTLESRAVAAEDIARQVLTYGHRKSPQVFIDGLEKVTKEDLKKLVSAMLKTPLSMASMGNVSNVPRYAEVARRFG